MIERDSKGKFMKGHKQMNTGRTYFKKGDNGYWKGKKNIELTKRNLENNPMKKLETRKKSSKTRKKLFKEGKIKSWNIGLKIDLNKYPNYGMKDKKHLEKSKDQMCKSHKGNTPWNKNKTYEELYGIERSKELKKICSESNIGKIPWNIGKNYDEDNRILSKERHPNWLDGISFEPYGIEFDTKLKEQIGERENYRGQQCFRHQDELFTKKGRKYKLNIHHIDFCKTNNNPNNLISLCKNCHMQTNFNREKWIEYFQDKIKEVI